MSISHQIKPSALQEDRSLDNLSTLKGSLPMPVLLYLMAVVLPVGINLGSVAMTGVRLLLIILIVPLSLNLLRGKYGRFLLTDALFFLHFAWIIIALAVNNPDKAIQNAGATGIEFIGGYVLGRAYIRDRTDFISLVRVFGALILCSTPLIIYEALTGKAIVIDTLSKLPGFFSLPDLEIGERLGLNRVQGSFAHPIHWGLFCSLSLSLYFVGLKDVDGLSKRLGVSIAIGLCGFLALSSGALLAIILQLSLILWAWVFREANKRWLTLLGLMVFFYIVIDLLSNRTPVMVFLSYATFSSHTAYWRTIIFDWGMYNVGQNPIFGLGLNDWVRPSWMYSSSMDNFWLVMAVQFGIPGFVFIAAGYLIALWNIGRRKFDHDIVLWSLRRAWVFSFVGLSFTLSTVHIWHTIYSFVFFIFGAGIWMLDVNTKEKEAKAQTVSDAHALKDRIFRRQDAGQVQNTSTPCTTLKNGAPQTSEPDTPYTRFPKKTFMSR